MLVSSYNLDNILHISNSIGDGPASPFWLDGWLKWNEEMWNLKSERVLYTSAGKDFPRMEGVLYTDKNGNVRMPPRNPYLPFLFSTSGTDKPDRVYRQYLDIMDVFTADLLKRGIRGKIALPPGFIDARPFQWKGMDVGLHYTFLQTLPYDLSLSDSSIKNKINKAKKMGYSIKQSNDWVAVLHSLKETEEAKSFSHHTDYSAIFRCSELLGSNSFLGYVGYDSTGEPVAGGLRLLMSSGVVIDWSQGAVREHLNNGIIQLMYNYVLDDAYNRGGKLFDWTGANTPPVALAKSAWGSVLTPYLVIRSKDYRYTARTVVNFFLKRK